MLKGPSRCLLYTFYLTWMVACLGNESKDFFMIYELKDHNFSVFSFHFFAKENMSTSRNSETLFSGWVKSLTCGL